VLAESVGDDATADLWQWTETELVELERLAGDAFRPTGSLRLAVDEEERDELREEYEALRAAGFSAEWREDLDAPLSRYPAALFHPPDGVLQPARLVRRIAECAAAAGVEIHEHTRIGSLDEADANTVVVATDGYPSGLLGELDGLVVPTRGQVIATEPIEEMLFEIPHYGRHGFDYWHQRLDGRIVAGGFRDVSIDTEFTADEVTTPVVQEALERFVEEHVGRPLRVDYRWAGIFGMVFDFLPVVGQVPGQHGVWIAGGYSGHGNVLGFACGRLVARAILGERDSKLELFEPSRLLVH
jgi:glycine/D-amino acid oxidase-like deaminating enzyme